MWTSQSRLDEIVGNVSRGRSKKVWNIILGGFGLIYLALFAGAIGSGQEDASQGFDVPFTYVSANLFQYEQVVDSLRYPSCTLTSDLGDSPIRTMADYAYLAGHAYRGTETSQEELDQYFVGLNVTDRQDWVQIIRNETIDSTVSFKVVTAPGLKGNGDYAYLIIRGTVTPWDAMTDAQLWSPAALFQFLRIMLPFGKIWTPVIPYMISAITALESETIDQISFYKDTVQFVNFVKENFPVVGQVVTGHSLGGGLSIITGAITKTPAVALSGPNTMLVRGLSLKRLLCRARSFYSLLTTFSFRLVGP
jgi:lipase ATG15